ncbi:SLBB domain-containing protein [Candidatus Woesebacteria bacterium]|nr:SLBB domain-containing protein [Candidatus Woesebacteria bacterium]
MRFRFLLPTRLKWGALWHTVLASAGIVTMGFGGLFTYKTHFEHPKLSYIPPDDVWREQFQAVLQSSQGNSEILPSSVVVDVSGAVQNPGVYSLSPGARVQDALLQANGFLESADQKYIHQQLKLAEKVVDQQKIYIPFREESPLEVKGESSAPPSSGSKSINQATLAELDAIYRNWRKTSGNDFAGNSLHRLD